MFLKSRTLCQTDNSNVIYNILKYNIFYRLKLKIFNGKINISKWDSKYFFKILKYMKTQLVQHSVHCA